MPSIRHMRVQVAAMCPHVSEIWHIETQIPGVCLHVEDVRYTRTLARDLFACVLDEGHSTTHQVHDDTVHGQVFTCAEYPARAAIGLGHVISYVGHPTLETV